MTVTQALAAFCIAAGLLTMAPGLDTALVLRTAAAEGPRGAALAGLGVVMGCLLGTVWFALLILATRPIARALKRPSVVSRLDRLTGLVFLTFGVKLALVRQH